MNLFLFGKTQPKKINNAIFERKKNSVVNPVRGCEMTIVQIQGKLARSSSLQPLTVFLMCKKTNSHINNNHKHRYE